MKKKYWLFHVILIIYALLILSLNFNFSFSILCYHNIKPTAENEYDVFLNQFEKQMKYLYENQYQSLKASEVAQLLKNNEINTHGLILNTIKAKEFLFRNVGIEPITFAYPFGLYNEKVIEYVKNAGFIAAFNIDGKKVTKKTDLFKIPRYIISKKTSFEYFKQIVNLK